MVNSENKKLSWTKERKELKGVLKERSELLCNLYLGAIKVYNLKSIPNNANLSAHSLREIMHKLPGELIVKAERDGMHLKSLVINLKEIWSKKINKEYYREDVSLNEYGLKQIKNFLESVETFFDDAEAILEIKEELSLAIIHHLQSTGGLGNLSDSIKKKQITIWKQSWEYFVRLAHHDNKHLALFENKLQKLEKLLSDLLKPRTFSNFKKLKSIIKSAGKIPSIASVYDALDIISNDEEEKYFYQHLKPFWLNALKEAGIFKTTPMIVQDKMKGMITFPDWPPTIFLKNSVNINSIDVLDVLLNLPPIKNSRVFEDLMDVIVSMPPTESTKLEKTIIHWFSNKHHFRLFGKTAELVSTYFACELDDSALALSRKTFDIIDSKHANKTVGLYAINEWEYDNSLSKIIPNIKNANSKIEFIKILCHKLKKSVSAELSNKSKDRDFEDLSSVWRRSLLEDNYVGSDDIRDVLISQIIKLCRLAIDQNPNLVEQLIQNLFVFDYPIFGRIGLLLLEENESNNALVLSCLLNFKFSTSSDVFHEYANLLKTKFHKLSSSEQEIVLERLKSLSFDGGSEKYNNYRRFRLLYVIKSYLNDTWKDFYATLSKEYEEDRDPGFLFHDVVVEEVKPKSTITFEELNSKNISEICSYFHNWQPPENERFGEYTYGLSQVLEKIVIQRADEITAELSQLKLTNGTLVRGLIYGFTKLVSDESNISWSSVLPYLFWVISQNNNLLKPGEDTDSGWRGAKDATFKLIEKGFHTKKFPISLKDQVWPVIFSGIERMDTNDPDNSDDKDYYISAINDSKGVAFECATHYGLWVMREENIKPINSSYENYPELFAILEKYLDFNISKSKKLRAVYGRWLYWIYLLDSAWVENHVNDLFPQDAEYKEYLNALWASYLLYGNVSGDLFPVIEPQYRRSLDELSDSVVGGHDLMGRVTGHIVSLYLGGYVELNSELMINLYAQATLDVRASIINTMGRYITKTSVNRAMRFWEFRIKACDERSDWSELIDFGWWVKSGLLSVKWMLEKIILVLEKASNIDPTYMVIEEIGQHAFQYPEMVVRIIALVVNNRVNDHGIFMWDRYLHPILPVLLQSDVRSQTIDVVHKLGALGLTDFGRYLDN